MNTMFLLAGTKLNLIACLDSLWVPLCPINYCSLSVLGGNHLWSEGCSFLIEMFCGIYRRKYFGVNLHILGIQSDQSCIISLPSTMIIFRTMWNWNMIRDLLIRSQLILWPTNLWLLHSCQLLTSICFNLLVFSTWNWRGYNIRYQYSGTSGPALVLIHGFGANRSTLLQSHFSTI